MSPPKQLITGTDFIALPVADYEKSAQFYGETLGLPFGKRWGNLPAGEFETGNLTVAIMQADAFGMELNPNAFPVEFHVDDYHEAKAELESRGIEFQHEIDSGVCHQGFFRDPDGNALAIHQRYAQGAPPGATGD